MRRYFVILIIGQLIGLCYGETATFIYKDGRVEFGEFRRMSADSVFLEKTGNGGMRENTVILKQLLSEVIFDSGEKLNMSLPEYPPSVPQEQIQSPEVIKQKPSISQDRMSASVPVNPAPVQEVSVVQPPISPFVYGGLSAIVPGLGQFLLGERGKGAICFGVVGASILGTMVAWNYTTTAYNDLQQHRSANGSYKNSDYRKFTVRLHGSQILTGVSAALYLLNIADASADAFTIKIHPSQKKSHVTVSSTGAGCALAITF